MFNVNLMMLITDNSSLSAVQTQRPGALYARWAIPPLGTPMQPHARSGRRHVAARLRPVDTLLESALRMTPPDATHRDKVVRQIRGSPPLAPHTPTLG